LSSGAPVHSDTFKITVLDHAVQNVPDLRQTRILYNTLGLHFKTTGSFQSYFDLLHRAATVYDSTVFANPSTRPNRDTNRRVFATDIMASSDVQDDGYYYDAEYDYGDSYDYHERSDDHFDSSPTVDIDTPLSTINVYAAQRSNNATRGPPRRAPGDPSTRLPDSVFAKLTAEDKHAWFRLGMDARRMILASTAPTDGPETRSNLPVSPPSGISSVNRRVLMSETTAAPPSEPIQDDLGTSTTSKQPNPVPTAPTKSSPPTPGDLRRLLSTSYGQTGAPTWSVNKTLTYTLQKANVRTSSIGALIDRGANGGIAGCDCRVIARNPDSFVNIEGIDRHQLTHIPVVTCGAYCVTKNHGPVS